MLRFLTVCTSYSYAAYSDQYQYLKPQSIRNHITLAIYSLLVIGASEQWRGELVKFNIPITRIGSITYNSLIARLHLAKIRHIGDIYMSAIRYWVNSSSGKLKDNHPGLTIACLLGSNSLYLCYPSNNPRSKFYASYRIGCPLTRSWSVKDMTDQIVHSVSSSKGKPLLCKRFAGLLCNLSPLIYMFPL